MKIAISSMGKTKEDLLDIRFGRCEYFQIYNTENKEIIILENKGLNASGGAGIAAANQLIEEKVNVVVTGKLGPNAFDIIDKEGIKAYSCDSLKIIKVMEYYNKGELKEIKMAGPSHQG
ncbi:NifB/NifX family molybdenum-iron cluster-binding protein [Haloimpatiens sp. FM7315]|uniref:NifB/NifX family molybdenum-iron cluster-binding protein n=1 Tax=Haloimpatiens sp. FM7315 TaxID=3298609 RepID=UPI0035A2A56A